MAAFGKKCSLLVTGATGNVGRALLRHIDFNRFSVTAAVRSPEKARSTIEDHRVTLAPFDFETGRGFELLGECDTLFLMRPPHIGNVRRDMKSFIDALSSSTISRTLFLSVQGADTRSWLPHAQLEKMIRAAGCRWIFMRPAYFMDNLLTTLGQELIEHGRIYLPAGTARFNWIDVDDIGRAGAHLLNEFDRWENSGYTFTGSENLGFNQVVDTINSVCNTHFSYRAAALVPFIVHALGRGDSPGYVAIQLLLHYLPKFQRPPTLSNDFTRITGTFPHTLRHFVQHNAQRFTAMEKGSR